MRATVMVAVSAYLLGVLYVAAAVADVAMSSEPAFTIQYGTWESDFGVLTVVNAEDQPRDVTFQYTVKDEDKFTPGPTPLPYPPYNQFNHVDNIHIYNQYLVNPDPAWCTGVIVSDGGWAQQIDTTAELHFDNQSGVQRVANIQIRWEDQGLEAIGVPPAQRHGTAHDGVLYKCKVINVAPR